jgi:caa(3)-type oxidase subunit IV
MQTTCDMIPPYGPAEEIYRSTRRNLVAGLIVFCGTLATILVTTVPALDLGARGFDQWDVVLALGIATFHASLIALMFMYLTDEHEPAHWAAFTVTMHAAAILIALLMNFADSPLDRYDSSPKERESYAHSS